MAGLVALVFAVLIMVKVIHDADIEAVLLAQAADSLQSRGAETSSQSDKTSPFESIATSVRTNWSNRG